MLAKQAWRLHFNSDSTLFRILKEKYVPNDNLLIAQLGYWPFFTWKGIMEGKKVLHLVSINILVDQWLPKPRSFKVCSPVRCLPPTTKVSALINYSSSTWNMDLIRDNFWEEEANMIQGLPLSTNSLTIIGYGITIRMVGSSSEVPIIRLWAQI
ncbi:hypothetical protein ACH5RR_000939 [Cinchona calisaya]|uniref:Uncharacterized protein n=1 Tax=Cinchona calisaya TaxID=153742 RepID=A0ABD3B2S2_9GENT